MGGRGRGGKGLKRKGDSIVGAGGTSRNKVKRIAPGVVVDSQDDDSEWINSNSQSQTHPSKSSDCKICNHTIDLLPAADDPLDYLCCDFCNGSTHIACLGYSSVFSEPFKDLIGLLGWQCPDCKDALKFKFRQLETTCATLKLEVTDLKNKVTNLQKELALKIVQKPTSSHLLMTSVSNNCDDTNNKSSKTNSQNPLMLAGVDNKGGHPSSASYSGAVTRNTILKVVHSELVSKKLKKNNIVISGIKASDVSSDKALALQILSDNFNLPSTSIIECKRLGEQKENKIQPMLVTLPDETTVCSIIENNRKLRHSPDEYTRNNVYINPDRTRGEQLAAYELRQKRRAKQLSQDTPQPDEKNPGCSSTSKCTLSEPSSQKQSTSSTSCTNEPDKLSQSSNSA